MPFELTREELVLIREALEDAMVFRDSRSRVLQRAVRLKDRPAGDTGEADRRKARAYEELAVKLRKP